MSLDGALASNEMLGIVLLTIVVAIAARNWPVVAELLTIKVGDGESRSDWQRSPCSRSGRGPPFSTTGGSSLGCHSAPSKRFHRTGQSSIHLRRRSVRRPTSCLRLRSSSPPPRFHARSAATARRSCSA